MTDANESANEGRDGETGTDAPAVTYPEQPALPEARLSLTFKPGSAPMVTARAQTVSEIKELLEEMNHSGVFADIGRIHAELGAAAQMGSKLGAQQVDSQPTPQAPPQQAAPQMPMGMPQQAPQQPNQPYQGQPAWQQAGAPQVPQQGGWQGQQQGQQGGWNNGGGSAGKTPYPAPQGWLRTTASKPQMEALAAQYQIPKGNPSKGGKWNFFGAPAKGWYVAPDVAGAFAQYSPVPA